MVTNKKYNNSPKVAPYTSGNQCTHGDLPVKILDLNGGADKNGSTLWACGQYDVRDALRLGYKFDLLISLNGMAGMNAATEGPKVSAFHASHGGEEIFEGVLSIPEVKYEGPRARIEWPDYGVPGYDSQWWLTFVADLRKVKGNIAIFCMGGHGRTGTALAAIIHHLGIAPKGVDDMVEWLRGFYCQKSVESQSQVAYLQALGVKTDVDPAKGMAVAHYSAKATAGKWSGSKAEAGTWDDEVDAVSPKSMKEFGNELHKAAVCMRNNVEEGTPFLKMLDEVGDIEFSSDKGACNLCTVHGLWDDESSAYLCDDCFHVVEAELEDLGNKVTA